MLYCYIAYLVILLSHYINYKDMPIEYQCVLGTYRNNKIITDTGEIPAKAYVSRHSGWNNRYGFWQLKLNSGWDFWVITEFLEVENPMSW